MIFENIIAKSRQIGLKVNPSKCELFFCSGVGDENVISKFQKIAPNIKVVDSVNLNLLGFTSGIWLNVIHRMLAYFLNNNVLRISMALRLGTDIFKPHHCIYGEKV